MTHLFIIKNTLNFKAKKEILFINIHRQQCLMNFLICNQSLVDLTFAYSSQILNIERSLFKIH